jgi:hypothetical protein
MPDSHEKVRQFYQKDFMAKIDRTNKVRFMTYIPYNFILCMLFFLTIILCMLYHFEVVSYTNTLVWQKKFYKICRFSFLWMIKICIGISWLLTWLIITYVCWIRCPVKIETGQDKKMSWKWYLLFIPFI